MLNLSEIKMINKVKGFSLIEIIVSLAIFSFIFSIVIGVSISLVRSQTIVQSQVFLTQTGQTLLDNLSRNLRYGYSYSGGIESEYNSNAQNIYLNLRTVSQDPSITATGTVRNQSAATTSQILTNVVNSPYIVYQDQSGDPLSYKDQVAYCFANNNLYKITNFAILTNEITYYADCKTGQKMIPDSIKLEQISFDVFGQSSENPKNPMVRIKFKISDEFGKTLLMQTTITQRQIQIL